MRKMWWTLLLLAVVVVGAATVVQARGPMGGGRGMMGGGYGMMGGGGMPCLQNWDLSEAALAERLQLQLTMAKAQVEFWTKATATDALNQEWIASRLAMAQQHVAWLEAELAK